MKPPFDDIDDFAEPESEARRPGAAWAWWLALALFLLWAWGVLF